MSDSHTDTSQAPLDAKAQATSDDAGAADACASAASTIAAPPGASASAGTGVMAARGAALDDRAAPAGEALQRAACDARASGRRFDLMRYLRLRRRRSGA